MMTPPNVSLCASISATAASMSLNGATSMSSTTLAGIPAESGMARGKFASRLGISDIRPWSLMPW